MAAETPNVGTGAAPPGFEAYAAEEVPQMRVGAPGKEGKLELRFEVADDGQTRLVHDFARVPYHVGGTIDNDPHDEATAVVIQSPTGGVAQGDRLDVDVEVGEGATAHVSTQSSTKIQSMDANYASATIDLRIRDGAHLDYLPEPTILYAGSRYRQDLTVEVAPGSSAFLAEVVVPGRLARGERFDFDRYHARVRAVDDEGLRFEDATDLTPSQVDSATLGVLGDADVYGTCYVLDPTGDVTGLSDTIHEELAGKEPRAGATTLPNETGVAVRLLGNRADEIQSGIRTAWNAARRELIGAPAPERRRY